MFFFDNKAPIIMLACYGQIKVLFLFYIAKGLSTRVLLIWFHKVKQQQELIKHL